MYLTHTFKMGHISRSLAQAKVLKPQLDAFDASDFLRRFTCGFSVHVAAEGGRIGQVVIAAASNAAAGCATYSVVPASGDVILEGEFLHLRLQSLYFMFGGFFTSHLTSVEG